MRDLAKYKNEKLHVGHLFPWDGKPFSLRAPPGASRGGSSHLAVQSEVCSAKHRRAACSPCQPTASAFLPSCSSSQVNSSVQSHVGDEGAAGQGRLDVLADGVRGLVELNPHAFFTC